MELIFWVTTGHDEGHWYVPLGPHKEVMVFVRPFMRSAGIKIYELSCKSPAFDNILLKVKTDKNVQILRTFTPLQKEVKQHQNQKVQN